MSHWLEAAMLAEREAPVKAFELKPLRRRSRTGRNFQLLLKVKREIAERFAALADDAGVCFGEFLEKTLDAYVREQEGRAKGSRS
jgi:DNA-binding helix-hairpin-helix protein with protein kinase domain